MKTIRHFFLYGISKGLLLKIIIFLIILLIGKNVFAQEYTITNSITAPSGSGSTGGHYLGLEIYNSGSQNNYTVNTRYNGTLSEIIYNLPLPSDAGQCFTTNMDYTVTMEMATEDWRNHFSTPFVGAYSSATNWASSGVTFVSMKKIYFKFKIPSSETSCVDFVYVRLQSTSVANTPFTGTSNWKLSKITLTDQYTNSGGSSGGGSSGGGSSSPTPDPNQNIINNDNQNTQNIIENNNQNTQQIVDSIDNGLKTCVENLIKPSNYRFTSGSTYNGVTLTTNSDKSITFSGTVSTSGFINILQVDDSTTYFNSDILGNDSRCQSTGYCLNVPNDFGGFGFSYQNGYVWLYGGEGVTINYTWKPMLTKSSTVPTIYVQPGEKYCTSKIDDTTNAISNVNDTLNNDNVDSGTGSDFFNSFATDDNGGISAIVTKPLMLINTLLSSNNQCANLALPEFLGVSNAYLPSGCILWNNATPAMINVWNILVCGFASYLILKDIFRIVENLKNPDNDKVEVMDL